MRAVFIGAILSVALAGCTTVGPVSPADSMIVLEPQSSALPGISRTRSWDGQDLVEEWEWASGQLYIVRLERTKYYGTNFRAPEELIEDVETWPTLVRGGTTFRVRDVQSSRNHIGEFIYAVSQVDSRGDRCFLMIQGLPASGGASFEPIASGTSSQGYVSFYECRPAATTSAEKLEDLMLNFAEAFKYVMR